MRGLPRREPVAVDGDAVDTPRRTRSASRSASRGKGRKARGIHALDSTKESGSLEEGAVAGPRYANAEQEDVVAEREQEDVVEEQAEPSRLEERAEQILRGAEEEEEEAEEEADGTVPEDGQAEERENGSVDPRAVLEENAADLDALLTYSYEYLNIMGSDVPKSAWLPAETAHALEVEAPAETPTAGRAGERQGGSRYEYNNRNSAGERAGEYQAGKMGGNGSDEPRQVHDQGEDPRASEKRKRMMTPVKRSTALSRSPFAPPTITPRPKKRVPRADPVSNYHRMSQMRSAQEKMKRRAARQSREKAAELAMSDEPARRVHAERSVHAGRRAAWH